MTKIYNKHSQKFKRIKLREDQTESEELLWKYLRNKKMCGVKFKLREEHIERTGIKFLRIKNSDLDNVTDVLNKISSLVTSLLEKH